MSAVPPHVLAQAEQAFAPAHHALRRLTAEAEQMYAEGAEATVVASHMACVLSERVQVGQLIGFQDVTWLVKLASVAVAELAEERRARR